MGFLSLGYALRCVVRVDMQAKKNKQKKAAFFVFPRSHRSKSVYNTFNIQFLVHVSLIP